MSQQDPSNKDIFIVHLSAAVRAVFVSLCPGHEDEAATQTLPPVLVEENKQGGKDNEQTSIGRNLYGKMKGFLPKCGLQINISEQQLATQLWNHAKRALPAYVIEPSSTGAIGEDGFICFTLCKQAIAPPQIPANQIPEFDYGRLNNPGYLRWLRVGLGLKEISKVLSHVVHHEAEQFHDELLVQMEGVPRYKGNKTQYNADDPIFEDLRPWIAEITKRHNQKNKSKRKMIWSNTDATKLCEKGGFWEVMKLFCASVGFHKSAITEHVHAEAMDSVSLLAMMQWCDIFNNHCNRDLKNLPLPPPSTKRVQNTRNAWAHLVQKRDCIVLLIA